MAYGSFEEGGITVQSSEHSDEQLAENLTPVVDDTVVESDAPAPVEVAPEPKPKPRNDPKARVEQATAKEATAKRERDEARTEAAALKARLAEVEGRTAMKPAPVPAPAPQADLEPTVDQFDTYEKFVQAQARWAARQEFRTQQETRHKEMVRAQHRATQDQIEQTFGERWAAARAEDPAFEAQVNPRLTTTLRVGALPEGVPATFDNFLVEQIFRSKHPKALALHLSDPTTYQRLATLHPLEVLGELAIFGHSQSAASPSAPAPQAPVSHAKPPIKPVGSSPVAADSNEIPDDLDVDEHIRRMNARDRKERRAS